MSHINKERLINLFCELARIKSPTGQEREISQVVVNKLESLGLQVKKDAYGNIIAKLLGEGEPIILCGHLDTVAIGEGSEIKPTIKENRITSDGTTILGADNKDNISAILEVLTILSEKKLQHRSIEIVFTLGEESISVGAKNLDISLLKGKECIISDLADTYGTITLSAPYCFRFTIKVIGKRSHVKKPEEGINAVRLASEAISKMPLGKIDEFTTANIAYQIAGLKGVIDASDMNLIKLEEENRNTVPDLAVIFGEVRGARLESVKQTLQKIEKVFKDTASRDGGGIEFSVEKLADGYYFKENDRLISLMADTFRSQGVKPRFYHSLGGSDANVLNGRGIKTVVISSPHKDNHKLTECLSINDFMRLTDFYLRLVLR